MDDKENIYFEDLCDSLIDFITDIETNIALKEVLGICPLEIASLIAKDRKEMKD